MGHRVAALNDISWRLFGAHGDHANANVYVVELCHTRR